MGEKMRKPQIRLTEKAKELGLKDISKIIERDILKELNIRRVI